MKPMACREAVKLPMEQQALARLGSSGEATATVASMVSLTTRPHALPSEAVGGWYRYRRSALWVQLRPAKAAATSGSSCCWRLCWYALPQCMPPLAAGWLTDCATALAESVCDVVSQVLAMPCVYCWRRRRKRRTAMLKTSPACDSENASGDRQRSSDGAGQGTNGTGSSACGPSFESSVALGADVRSTGGSHSALPPRLDCVLRARFEMVNGRLASSEAELLALFRAVLSEAGYGSPFSAVDEQTTCSGVCSLLSSDAAFACRQHGRLRASNREALDTLELDLDGAGGESSAACGRLRATNREALDTLELDLDGAGGESSIACGRLRATNREALDTLELDLCQPLASDVMAAAYSEYRRVHGASASTQHEAVSCLKDRLRLDAEALAQAEKVEGLLHLAGRDGFAAEMAGAHPSEAQRLVVLKSVLAAADAACLECGAMRCVSGTTDMHTAAGDVVSVQMHRLPPAVRQALGAAFEAKHGWWPEPEQELMLLREAVTSLEMALVAKPQLRMLVQGGGGETGVGEDRAEHVDAASIRALTLRLDAFLSSPPQLPADVRDALHVLVGDETGAMVTTARLCRLGVQLAERADRELARDSPEQLLGAERAGGDARLSVAEPFAQCFEAAEESTRFSVTERLSMTKEVFNGGTELGRQVLKTSPAPGSLCWHEAVREALPTDATIAAEPSTSPLHRQVGARPAGFPVWLRGSNTRQVVLSPQDDHGHRARCAPATRLTPAVQLRPAARRERFYWLRAGILASVVLTRMSCR